MQCCEISIKYKRKKLQMPPITDAKKVFELMKLIKDFRDNIDYIEMAYAIYLDNSCNTLGILKLSEGTINTCFMDTRKVFQGAILSNAKAFILVHNHPSGNLTFSEQDRKVFKTFEKTGELMDIKLMDFLIISNNNYLSIK